MTSASQSLRTLAKEKLRQAELDRRFAKKLAKAEATLQRLLEPHGLAQHATSFPAEDPVMLSAPELGLLLPADGVSTEAGGNDGDCAGDSSAAFASAPTAGAQSPRSSVLGATAPIAAPAEPALACPRGLTAPAAAASTRAVKILHGACKMHGKDTSLAPARCISL